MGTNAKRKAMSKPTEAAPASKRTTYPSRKALLDVKVTRTTYGLSGATFARMLGLSEEAEARLEKGQHPTDENVLTRFHRVREILKKAAGAMRLAYVPTWVEKPSPACAEIEASAPIDLMERGDYDAVEDLLFFLGSGVPY